MLFIFDLDYTLLDSKKFKKDLAKALKLSMGEFNNSYKKYFTDKKLPYNLDIHIGAISSDKKYLLKNNVNKFLEKIDGYLFPGAVDVLGKLKKDGHKLMLLTYGDVEWQKYKVENLKIKKYFYKIIYTDKIKGNKINFLRKYSEGIVVINDNARECLEMKEVLPDAEIFLIKSQYSNNAKHDFKIRKLKELIFMNI